MPQRRQQEKNGKSIEMCEDSKKDKIKITTLNTKGRKIDDIIEYMNKKNIDIAAIQEIMINTNSHWKYRDHYILTSTFCGGEQKKNEQGDSTEGEEEETK